MTTQHPTPLPSLAATFPGDEVMAILPEALPRLWTPSPSAPRSRLHPVAQPAGAEATPARADYDDELDEDDGQPDDGNTYADGVGVVCIDGPLMQRGGWWWDGYESIAYRVNSALTRPGVRVVALKINSPGGVAAGCFEAAKQIRANAAAAGVPVVAFVDEMACSAAYALACAASEIWMPPSGAVGSVGVIATYHDLNQMFKDAGIRHVILTSGKAKADGHPGAPFSKDVVDRLRKPVDHLAGLFFQLVGQQRRMTSDAVKALEAEVFWGQSALGVGLADRMGSLADFMAYAQRLAADPAPMAAAASNPVRYAADRAAGAPMSEINAPDPVATPAADPASLAAPVAEMVARTEHDLVVRALESTIATRDGKITALTAEVVALAAKLSETETSLTRANDRFAASEKTRIAAKVESMVGLKLTPAERDLKLKQALRDESEFDAEMAVRPDLSLDAKRIIAESGNEVRPSDSPDGNIEALNRKAAEHMAAHPGVSRAEALRVVMQANPDLCR